MPPVQTRSGFSPEGIKRILRAAGLWQELNVNKELKDEWGWLVNTADEYEGFITRTSQASLGGTDYVRRCGSTLALTDGKLGHYVGDWAGCADLHAKDGSVEKGYFQKRRFRVHEASFALTEHYFPEFETHIPERIFLYPYSPQFDVGRIVASLAAYRHKYQPRIFLCATTKQGPGSR